jgi:hypothetical protein
MASFASSLASPSADLLDPPAFAKDYPNDAALTTLVEAFEAGNYRAVRSGVARILADSDQTEPVKAAARDLRARTEPSRAQIALLVIAGVLVVVLSGYEIVRHGPGSSAPASGAPRPTIERIR